MPREPVPDDVAADVLFAADRVCCICNIHGKAVQLHHIDDNPSNNDPSNLAVLCLQCHDDTQVRGGFGRRLNVAQVRKYRDEWHTRVATRRTEADHLAVAVVLPQPLPSRPPDADQFRSPEIPPPTGLIEYVATLPQVRALAYAAAAPGWGGATSEMVDASWSVTDVMIAALVRLARWYPYGHFGDDSRAFFTEIISARAKWYHHVHSTGGIGFSGTIVGPMTGSSVLADAEGMVADAVAALLGYTSDEFSYEAWLVEWRADIL